MQALFRKNKQEYLANHVIATKQAATELECGLHCVRHGSCLSVNYKISGFGKGLKVCVSNFNIQTTFTIIAVLKTFLSF